MRIITLSLFSVLAFAATSFSQQVVSMTYQGAKTKAQITNMFGLPLFKCGADYYQMTYTSVDAKGNLDTLSGLVAIPDDPSATYPVLMYEHGTSACKTCVPSRYGQSGGDEGQAALMFSGMGYIALLPDYVGMGDGRGFQTYVHAGTSVSASEDMLKAFRAWAPDNDVLINQQLFITGYSQGGYASMAFHRYMQETYGEQTVTAAAHNSGPYSLSGAMRDLILVDSAYSYPAYIPNTMLGMNEVYEMYTDINEFFNPEYTQDIQKYYDGEISLTTLNARIIDTLVAYNGASVAHHMIKNNVLLEITNNPSYIINQILRDNDVYKWQPKSPTRIFYCKADDQVPYVNSIIALDTMYAEGADPNLVKAVDVDSTLNHTGCVTPAFTQTILFFAGFQSTTLATTTIENGDLHIYPNPVNDKFYVKGDVTDEMTISIWDLNGKLMMYGQSINAIDGIDVSSFENGIYVIQLKMANGNVSYQKISVRK